MNHHGFGAIEHVGAVSFDRFGRRRAVLQRMKLRLIGKANSRLMKVRHRFHEHRRKSELAGELRVVG